MPCILEFELASEAETDRFGAAFARALRPGLVVALAGNLGAGKTRFVRAVAAGLGADPRQVSSPTFVLIHEYEGRLPIFHMDAYRLEDAGEFFELGGEELFASDGVCFIEWADRIASALPSDHLRIEIEPTGATSRRFRMIACAPAGDSLLAAIATDDRKDPDSPST